MSTHLHENHSHQPERPREPPTLPLPPLWRLVLAAAVATGFLYLMYSTYPESPPPAQGQSSSSDIVSS
jgi:hypothetical protein